jgi:hypothetical protein
MRRAALLLFAVLAGTGCRSRLPVAHVSDAPASPAAPAARASPAPASAVVGVVEYYQISDG